MVVVVVVAAALVGPEQQVIDTLLYTHSSVRVMRERQTLITQITYPEDE